MKSLSDVVANVKPTVSDGVWLPALASRVVPLDTSEITKMYEAVDRYFEVKREVTYGYIPVMEAGIAVRQEFDVTGEETTYNAKGETPQAMVEALLRPAKRGHIVYHLGRLAAHRRDTRGREALEVVLEDIANDLNGVSEWAVVLACAEMRKKDAVWYPTTAEISKVIRKYNMMLQAIRSAAQLEQPKETNTMYQAPKKFDQSQYYNDPRDNPFRRQLCDFLLSIGDEDYFEQVTFWSNYQLEMRARAKGWREKEKDYVGVEFGLPADAS